MTRGNEGRALVTVSTHVDPIAAHIMRCRLEADGIAAFVAHEHHVSMDWLVSNALGGVKVQVAAQDAAAARQVVAAVESGAYALPDEDADAVACPRCGSARAGEDKRAWSVSLMSSFLLSIPLPFSRHRLRCLACGYAGPEQAFGAAPRSHAPGDGVP